MAGAETICDDDVAGDSAEGLTFAFQDDGLMEGESSLFSQSESDEQRRVYIQDIFEGSDDIVTRWMSEQVTAGCIEINGGESRLLDGMKRVINPTLTACSRLVQKPLESMTEADLH